MHIMTMNTTAKQAACLTGKSGSFKQWVNNHAKEKEYSPGFGTELVTDWGTFWIN